MFEEMGATKSKGGAKRAHDKKRPTPTEVATLSFKATFGERYTATLCTDTCADDNIMDSHMAKAIIRAGVEYSIERLIRPRTFKMAASLPDGKQATLTYQQAMVVDVELQIRHGSALKLRGVRWLVTDQSEGEPLLGRPVLESLGLETRDILAAAAQRFTGEVDMTNLLPPPSATRGAVARLLEGVFYSDGGADETDLSDEDGWLDMGPESKTEKARTLKLKCDEAQANGMSNAGKADLEQLLDEFDDVIRMKLDSSKHA